MTEQEQEDRDYFPQNEWQLSYRASCQNRKPDDSQKIKEAMAAGQFVVVSEGLEYCPHTDALLPGSRKLMLGAFATRASAEAYCEQNEEAPWDEVSVYVLPRPEPPDTPLLLTPDDDKIPF